MIEYNYHDANDFDGAIHNLYDIVTILRSPGGCPWDIEQQCSDVVRALQDETFEYLDAINDKDNDACREEVGDVLLNVLMLLRIHQDQEDFAPHDAINEICRKLIRRHPHVFSNSDALTSTQVLDQWNAIKETVEGKTRDSDDFFSRVPKSLPPLAEASEIQKKVRKVGFDWPDTQGVIDKVCEELDEVIEANSALDRTQEEVEAEIGDLLFSVVNLARYLKVDPMNALHRTNRKFRRRFNEVSRICAERDIPLTAEHFKEMDAIWDEVKNNEY